MKHAHANSILAYRENRLDVFDPRELEVLSALERLGIASDREVMHALGKQDPNHVRPRITELISAGVLEECGSMKDPETGKTVRKVRISQEQGVTVAKEAHGAFLDRPLSQPELL